MTYVALFIMGHRTESVGRFSMINFEKIANFTVISSLSKDRTEG